MYAQTWHSPAPTCTNSVNSFRIYPIETVHVRGARIDGNVKCPRKFVDYDDAVFDGD